MDIEKGRSVFEGSYGDPNEPTCHGMITDAERKRLAESNRAAQDTEFKGTSTALSPSFLRALLDAEHYHHDQARKETQVPYVSHLLGVCSLVLEAGGTETEAIAALLHDAPEDAGGEPILRAIEANFGSEVATIVRECSDALPGKGEKKPPWLERKQAYIKHLRDAVASSMLVSAADKLHNLRAIYSDYLQIGDTIFERFSAPEPKKEHTLWYYDSVKNVYGSADGPRDPRRTAMTEAIGDLLARLGYKTGDFDPFAKRIEKIRHRASESCAARPNPPLQPQMPREHLHG